MGNGISTTVIYFIALTFIFIDISRNHSNGKEEGSKVLVYINAAVSFFIPVVGFVLFFIWKNDETRGNVKVITLYPALIGMLAAFIIQVLLLIN